MEIDKLYICFIGNVEVELEVNNFRGDQHQMFFETHPIKDNIEYVKYYVLEKKNILFYCITKIKK